jgi:hypothetical protein
MITPPNSAVASRKTNRVKAYSMVYIDIAYSTCSVFLSGTCHQQNNINAPMLEEAI